MDGMESETNAIKENAIRMAWHMRGGASYEDILNMSTDERKSITKLMEDNYETTKQEILHNIKSGRHVFAYVSKPPKLRPDYISSVRTGLFSIAKQLNIPITLVCIDYIDTYFGAITKQNFRIRIGDTFMVDDVSSNVFKVKKFFKETMNEFIRRKYENIYL